MEDFITDKKLIAKHLEFQLKMCSRRRIFKDGKLDVETVKELTNW